MHFLSLSESGVTDLSANFYALQTLRLIGSKLADVSALAGCATLHTLNLSWCGSLTDVSALADCEKLHTLDLKYCGRLTDVSALAGCATLHTLNLSHCNQLTDVSALAGCETLRELELKYCCGLTGLERCATIGPNVALHIISKRWWRSGARALGARRGRR